MGKLRDQMQADMTLKRFSVHTQKGYLVTDHRGAALGTGFDG
jgi:hypothetical protein